MPESGCRRFLNEYIIYHTGHLFAGMGAGLGTGFAGMRAAAVISPMLITFLGMEPYMAVGIALSSDVLASAVSHFAIGGLPDVTVWVLCIVFTLIWARIAAVFANKATPKTLNRVTGVILVVLGIVVLLFS